MSQDKRNYKAEDHEPHSYAVGSKIDRRTFLTQFIIPILFYITCAISIWLIMWYLVSNQESSETQMNNMTIETEKHIAESIIDFEYIQDVTYIITDKKEGRVTNRLNPKFWDYEYTLTVLNQELDTVYNLVVSERIYNRAITGKNITIQEGKDASYGLIESENGLVYIDKIKE